MSLGTQEHIIGADRSQEKWWEKKLRMKRWVWNAIGQHRIYQEIDWVGCGCWSWAMGKCYGNGSWTTRWRGKLRTNVGCFALQCVGFGIPARQPHKRSSRKPGCLAEAQGARLCLSREIRQRQWDIGSLWSGRCSDWQTEEKRREGEREGWNEKSRQLATWMENIHIQVQL